MKTDIIVVINQDLVQAIFEGARRIHPKETVLLLRGKRKNNLIEISDLVVPPLATRGWGFASVPLHLLPIDFSVTGTVHSHPSEDLTPSASDLNHFLGDILMIAGFPFVDERNIAVYSREGKRLKLLISKTSRTP